MLISKRIIRDWPRSAGLEIQGRSGALCRFERESGHGAAAEKRLAESSVEIGRAGGPVLGGARVATDSGIDDFHRAACAQWGSQ